MFTVNPNDFSLGVVDMAVDKSGQDQAIIVSSNIDTARKVTRFYQLENKIDADLEARLALVVPLIDPV